MKLRLPVRLLAAVVAAVSHVTFLTIASASGAWAVGENDDLLTTDSSFVADAWPSSAQQNADATLSDKEAEALGQAEAGLPEELEAMGSLEVTTPLTAEEVAAVSAAPAVASVGGANTTENVTGAKLLAEEAALVAEYNAIMPGAEGTETPAVTYSANNAAATQTAAAANLTVPETTVNSYKATSDALSAVSDSFSASVNPQPSAPTTETVSGSTGVAVSSPAASAPVFLMTGDVGAPSVLLTTAVGPTLHETTFIGNWMAIGDSISHGTHAYSYRWGLQKIFIDNGIGYDAIGVQKTSFWGDYDSASYGGGKFDNEHCAQFNVWASEVSGNAVAEYIYYSEQYSEQSLWYSNVKNWLGLSNELTGGNGDYSPSEHGDRFTTFTGETAPDTYTIMLGTNDLNKGRSNSDILADVAVILNAAQERAANDGNATVYVMSVPYARGTLSAEKISSYNTELQTWITKNKANYANLDIRYVNINDGLYDVTGTSGGGAVASMMQDWAHPTAQGDLIIAGNLAKGMGYAGRTAGQTRKAAADFAQGTYAGGFSALPTTGLTNVTLNGTGLDFSAANATASFNWDSTPTGGYTVDFSLALGNGSSGGWDTTNNFSITLGDGSLYGTLNVNEAYIKWGNTILYSRDAQTAANLRVAYVQADAANSLASGYYVWLDDQLIGEACGTSSGSAYNGVTFSYSGTGSALLSSLAMDSTNSWAPISTLTKTDEGYHAYNASDFRISKAKGLGDFSNANAGAAVTVIVSGKRLGTYNNVAYYYANYANDSANVGSCTTWSFTDGNTKAGYASYGLGNRTADVTARLTGACPGFKELYGALYHDKAATLTGNIHTQLDAEPASYGFYYGSKNMSVTGTVALTANEGTITGNVVGGFGAITTGSPSIGSTEVNINNHAVVGGNVYGGSTAAGTVGSTKVEITGGRVVGDVYGGGTAGTVTGDTQVYITGGEILGSVHGGGNGDTINGKDSVVVESHIPHIAGSIEATTVSIGNLHDGPSYDPDGFDKYKGTITAGGTITFTEVDSSNFAPTVIAQNVWLMQSDVHIKSLTLTACTITMMDDESTLTIDEKLVLGGVATYEGAGNLVIADNAQIDVSGLDLAGLAGAGSTVNLITTTGTGTLSTGDNLSFKFAEGFDPGNYSWSASGNNLVLSLNVPEGTDLIWNGSNGTWNTSDALWHKDGSSENTVFTANADVRFDAASNGSTVTLGEAITAGTMTIDSGVAVTINPNSKTLSATLKGAGTYIPVLSSKANPTLPSGVLLGEGWTGKVRLSGTGFTNLQFKNVSTGSNGLATAKSAIELRGVTGWMSTDTHDANLIMVDDGQTPALTIDNGSKNSTTTLSGKITGSGTLKHNWGNAACTFALTGDLSEWEGNFVKGAGNTTTLALKDNTNTTIAAGAQNADNGTLNVNINNGNAVTLSGEFSKTKTAGTLNINVGNEKATNATFTGTIKDGANLNVAKNSTVTLAGGEGTLGAISLTDNNSADNATKLVFAAKSTTGAGEYTASTIDMSSRNNTGLKWIVVDTGVKLHLTGTTLGVGGGSSLINSWGVSGGGLEVNGTLTTDGVISMDSGTNNSTIKGTGKINTKSLNISNGSTTTISGVTINIAPDDAATGIYKRTGSGTLKLDGVTLQSTTKDWTLKSDLNTVELINGNTTVFETGAGRTITAAAALSGNGGIKKTDAGTLALSGNNTFTGNVTVEGGTLKLGNQNGLGKNNAGSNPVSRTIKINTGGTIDINGQQNTCYAYTLNGGSLVNNGTATADTAQQTSKLELTANSSIGGTGKFYLLNNNWGNTSVVMNGNVLDKNGGNEVCMWSTAVTGGGTLRINSGSIDFNRKGDSYTLSSVDADVELACGGDNASLTGKFSLAANRTISATAAGAKMSAAVALQGKMTLNAAENASLASSGVFSGDSGSITKTGTGVVTLSGANTYSGGTTVEYGTLVAASANALGSGAITVNAGATLKFDSSLTSGVGTGAITLDGGTLVFSGADSTALNVGGALTLGSGSVLNLSQLKFSDDEGTIILAKTTDGVLGTLDDVVLNGASGFSYTLRLDDENSNYLVLAYESNITTRIWDNDSGSNLWTTSDANWHPTNNVTSHTGFNALDRAVFNSNATVTLNGEVLASSLTINNSKSVVLNMNANNFTIAEKVEGTGASLTFKGTDNDAEVANIAGGVSLKNLTVDGAHAVTVGGHVEVADKLTVKDAKLMEISGSTSANAIELENVDAANFQGKVASATTKITDSSMTLGADSGLGRLTLDNSTLTSNHAVILSETVDMQVSGSSSITGTGSITTTGMNLADGSTLSIAGGQTIHVTTEHGVTGNGTLSLGDVTLNAEMRSWSLAEDVAVSLTDATNGTKLSAVNHTLTVDSNMTGAGKLVKTGGGTVELTGTNSYTGGTEVNAGKLLISSAGALTGDVTVANGGTLSISDTLSSPATVGDLTVNQGGTLLLGGENLLKVGGTLTFGSGAALDLFNLDIVVDQKQYTLASGGTFTGYEGISLTFAPGIHAADGTTPSLTVTGEEGNQTLVLNYTLNTPHDLIWDGGTANWNNDTALWHAKNAGAASSTFATYDNVIFDGTDIAGRGGNDTPTLSEDVYATRMTVTERNNVTIDTNGYRLDVDFLQAGEGSTVTKVGNGNAYIGIADSGFAGNVAVLGGTLTLQYMDLKGKGLEIDGNLTRTGGTLNVVVGLEEAPSDVTLTGEVSGLASLLARQDSTVTFTKNVTMDSSVNTRITAEDGAVITFEAGANMTQRNWTIDGAGVVNIKGDTRFTQTNSTTERIGGTVTANFEHLISTTPEVNLKVEKGTTLNIDKLTLQGTERFYIDFQYTGDQQVDRQDVHIGNLEIKTTTNFSGIGINNTQVQELRAYQQNGSYYVDRVTGSGMAAFFNYGAPQGAAQGCQPTDGGWWVPQVFYVGGASVEDDDLFTGEIRLTDTYTNQVRPGQADRHKNTVVVLEDEIVASRSVITVSNWGSYSDFGLGIDAETVKTQGFNDVHFIDTNRFTVYSGTIGEEVNATYGSDDTVRTLRLTGKADDTASTTYSSSAGFDKNVNIVKDGAGKQTFKGDSSAFNADVNVQGGVLEFLNNTSLHIEDLTLAGNTSDSTANNLAIRTGNTSDSAAGKADVFGTAKVYDGSAINANMTMEGGSVLDVSNAVTKVAQPHPGVDTRQHDDYTGGLNMLNNNLTLHSGISLSDTDVRNLVKMGWGDTYALAYNVGSFTLGGETYTADALGWRFTGEGNEVTGTEASKYLANLQLDDYFICYSGDSKEAEGGTIDAHVVYIVKVPEPATTTLSLLALAALCARRRRK